MKIKLGLGQMLVEGGEPERNLERALAMVKLAKENSCDIVLLPETLDFAWTHPSSLKDAQEIPGIHSDLLCNAAAKNNIHICAGLTEKKDNKHYNTSILINNKGEIIGKHHKINLLEVEFPFYEVGQSLQVVDTPFGKIGLNICADNYIDSIHIGHALARMGAQLILSPSSWTVDHFVTEKENPYDDKWEKPFQILSSAYSLVIAGTTSVGYIVGGPYEGKKSVGCSLVMGPQGIIAQGRFNEFAGELICCEFEIPERKEKGTQIGKMLKEKGLS